MPVTINISGDNAAQAIKELSALADNIKREGGQVVAQSVVPQAPQSTQSTQPAQQSTQPAQQPINTATPQQVAQAYSTQAQPPVGQPAPTAGQTTAQVPTAPTAAPISQAPTQQAPVQQATPTAAPTSAPTSAPTYDFNQIATATMQLQQAGHNIFELFGQFGIQALNQLPKERYGEYANALRERGAKL